MGQYDRVIVSGDELVTRRTAKFRAHAQQIFHNLGGDGDFRCVQGSFSDGGNSANTHNGGAATDEVIVTDQWWLAEMAFRCAGGFYWHRLPLWRDGKLVWGDHLHGGNFGERGMDPSLVAQKMDFIAKKNGLSGHAPDSPKAWRPFKIINFHYYLGNVNLPNLVVEARKTSGWKDIPSVRLHQRALNIKIDAELKVDGIYGPMTKSRTKRWEFLNDWETDGIPGIKSETILQGALANVYAK